MIIFYCIVLFTYVFLSYAEQFISTGRRSSLEHHIKLWSIIIIILFYCCQTGFSLCHVFLCNFPCKVFMYRRFPFGYVIIMLLYSWLPTYTFDNTLSLMYLHDPFLL